MAAVKIARDPIASDSAADVPRRQWDTLMGERQRFCTQYLPKDCRNLLFFVEDGAANDWVGYGSGENYIRAGLGLDPDVVDWAVAGLLRLRPDDPVALDAAVVLGKREIGVAGGKSGPGRGHKTGDHVTRLSYGTSAAYLVAKLKRDAPEFAERLAAGEFPSARSCALAAGIIQETSPLTKLRRAWKHASPEQRKTFLAEIEST